MENKTVPPIVHHAPKDERAEWITPTIVDYDIEEAIHSSHTNPLANDGTSGYS